MTKSLDPKVLDRIKKLLATANGTNFEGEAATAMRMAQEYMAKYGVSLTDVELAEELSEGIVNEALTEEDGFNRSNPERWSLILAMAVAKVFDCKTYQQVYSRTSSIKFVGYASDVKMAKLIYMCMYVAVRAAACKAISRAGNPRLSFMLGVSMRLMERAEEEKKVAQQEPTGRFALVVRTKEDNIQDYLDERLNLRYSESRECKLDAASYHAGRAHGDRMDLMNREKVKQQPTLRIGAGK